MTTTKTLNKTQMKAVQSIINNCYLEEWQFVFVKEGFVYFTDGFRVVRLLPEMLGESDIEVTDYEDLPKKRIQTADKVVYLFNEAVEKSNNEHYRINKKALKTAFTNKKKENKSKYTRGVMSREKPILRFSGYEDSGYNCVKVNPKYLIDLLVINGGKIVDCYTGENALKPVVIGNKEDSVLSMLMPTRSKHPNDFDMFVTDVWEID
jgi:hypothetical protein